MLYITTPYVEIDSNLNMARHAIALVFVALALICLLQTTSAFDFVQYIREKLQNTIEKENITCSNYKQFCDKSSKEGQDEVKPEDAEATKMAATFCKAILRIHVCDVDLDKEPTIDEE